MMLSTAVREFLTESRIRLARATLDSYESDLSLLVALAKVQAADSVLAFSAALVRTYFLTLSEKGLAMATLHKRRASVNEFAKWCLMRRLIAESPMSQTPKIRRPKQLPRPFAADVQEKILALALPAQERVMRALLFQAGLRVSEVCGLRIGDVALGEHETDGAIRIHGKGNKERIVPLAPELWHVLRDYLLAAAAVDQLRAFVIARTDGQPFTRRMIERRTRTWGAQANLPDRITPHRFRHTFGTELLEAGADIRQVQDLMGHADISTTALYLEVTAQRLRSAVNLLSRRTVPEKVPDSGSAPPLQAPPISPSPGA